MVRDALRDRTEGVPTPPTPPGKKNRWLIPLIIILGGLALLGGVGYYLIRRGILPMPAFLNKPLVLPAFLRRRKPEESESQELGESEPLPPDDETPQ